jgi:hypothetical protein
MLAKFVSLGMLLGLVSLGCAPSVEPARASPQSPPEPRPRPALFEMHSGFWVNLHQRLYAEASPARPGAAPAGFTDEPAWTGAVEYYRGAFPVSEWLGLLDHAPLVAMNLRLSSLADAADLGGSGLAPELTAKLEAAAVVYRRAQWSKDDASNRRWIAAIEPALARHGDALAPDLAAVYRSPWPKDPIRVDVSVMAGPFGAYTVGEPPHITITSGRPEYQGDAALEMLFHEASHALISPIEERIAKACEATHKPTPPVLWHALLFFTTGEIVKRRLGEGYVPYADANGLYDRGPGWRQYREIFEREWRPYLAGKIEQEAAIRAIVGAL